MNWLLYVGGWAGGWLISFILLDKLFKINSEGIYIEMHFISWTCLWIWFCWRYI